MDFVAGEGEVVHYEELQVRAEPHVLAAVKILRSMEPAEDAAMADYEARFDRKSGDLIRYSSDAVKEGASYKYAFLYGARYARFGVGVIYYRPRWFSIARNDVVRRLAPALLEERFKDQEVWGPSDEEVLSSERVGTLLELGHLRRGHPGESAARPSRIDLNDGIGDQVYQEIEATNARRLKALERGREQRRMGKRASQQVESRRGGK